MRLGGKLDNRLVSAMRAGPDALPEDLGLLVAYLRLLAGFLEEKANELEPDWAQACAATAEIETLHRLEAAVAERAISVPADDLAGVRAKLEIWRALAAGAPDSDMSQAHNRLILSIDADLMRLQRPKR